MALARILYGQRLNGGDGLMKHIWCGLGALVLIAASPVQATVYAVGGSGTVSSVNSLQGSDFHSVTDGSIKVGDAFSFSFTFDTDNAVLTSLYDADPTTNIYYLGVTDLVANVGSYTYYAPSSYIGGSLLQTWNNRVVVIDPVDNQSFSFYGRGSEPLPFDLGIGTMLESLNLFAFDNSATARSSDLLSEIAPYSAFGTRTFEWLEYNVDAEHSIHVSGDYMATISPVGSVPEPSTWLTMIVGFGLMGVAMRRQSLRVRFNG